MFEQLQEQSHQKKMDDFLRGLLRKLDKEEQWLEFVERFRNLKDGEIVLIPLKFLTSINDNFRASYSFDMPQAYLDENSGQICVRDGNHRVEKAKVIVEEELERTGIFCRKVDSDGKFKVQDTENTVYL